MRVLLSCEHGGNEIPRKYQQIFKGAEEILNSHRGYDPAALDLFLYLRSLSDFSCFSKTSRLLVELNRSLHHPNLFSQFTKHLSKPELDEILEIYYLPYRREVEKKIKTWIEAGEKVLHISVHTFTPVFEEITRNADIGLLYDPARPEEKLLAASWKQNLKNFAPQLNVRFNYPYKGIADGFTTYLRRTFKENYLGIELEVNQKFCDQNKMELRFKNNLFITLQQEIEKRQKE